MEKSRESLVINIKIGRMYIVQRLAESIAENLRRDWNFDVLHYYNLSLDLLTGVGLDVVYAKAIMWEVVCEGYDLHTEYKRTGLYTYHNGSGSHPRLLVSKEAQDLVTLIRIVAEFDQEHRKKQAAL